jgi:hypothetical protein
MPATETLQREVEGFFESYGRAVERHDAALIADHYAYPAHITSDVGKVALVPVPSKEEWATRLEDLLAMYRKIGFHSATVLAVIVSELSPLLVQGRVHWALNDAEEGLLYDFDTTYTLGRFDDRFKITSVVVHNEIPRYRACLAHLSIP